MSLIKTIREKLDQGASLKDVKHIIKRQKEGKALANFNRYVEEIVIEKMHLAGKSIADIAAFTAIKDNHFELNWNEKRLAKIAAKLDKDAKKPKKEKPAAPALTPAVPETTAPVAPAAPAPEATAPVEEKKKRRKKGE